MQNTVVLYGSTTGNTKNIAKLIAKKLDADVYDVASFAIDKIANYKNLILGTSTWGIGDLQDDWESFIDKLSQANLDEKTVALFGLGDCGSYADSFVDAMGIIYKNIKDKNIKLVGKVSKESYDFVDSQAIADGQFVGLPLDEDSESNKTETRIDQWLESVKPALQ